MPGTTTVSMFCAAQIFELLAAAAEDEGIAAFQAQHALAGLGMLGQQRVDLVLALAVVALDLADIDALGIAAHVVQDLRPDQLVVEHDVGLLHQAMGAEGQQIGIARTGADDIDGAARGLGAIVQQVVGKMAVPSSSRPASTASADRAVEHFVPEAAALRGVA